MMQMSKNFDFMRLVDQPIYAMDFQFMIGDVRDFLEYSENNLDRQYRDKIKNIRLHAERDDFPDTYQEHLEANAEHRFKVSLPLRVRYSAVVALTTSVEWSVDILARELRSELSSAPKYQNKTVHRLRELLKRAGDDSISVVGNYEDIIRVRNCIVHSSGIVEHDEKHEQVRSAVERLHGFEIDNWNFLGNHVCIERGALNPYVEQMGNLVVALYKTAHERGLLRNDT